MLTVSATGFVSLKKQLRLLAMPPSRRKAFLKKFATEAKKSSAQRIKNQVDLNGAKFAPLKKRKGKALKRIMRGTKIYSGPNKATLTWANSLTGKIAREHQEGFVDRITATDMERRHGKPNYDAPATRDQARELIDLGYKKPGRKYKGGKNAGQYRTKRVSAKWIQENMTLGQAGVLIKQLRLDTTVNSSWNVKLPARAFFGLSKNDYAVLVDLFMNEQTTRAARAR